MAKTIFKIFLIFSLSMLAALFFVLTILSFACPLYMAEKFENVGMQKLAYGCYDKHYRQSNQVDQQYIMFNKAAEIDFDSHVVYYGERLLQNTEYKALCISISSDNILKANDYIQKNPALTENAQIRLKISVFNEDNFIKNQYVESLIDTNKDSRARNFAFDEIDSIITDVDYVYSAYTSFCLMPYLDEVKTFNQSELDKVETFYEKFSIGYSIDTENMSLNDRVVSQRLFEIAQVLSSAYKNAGNQNLANQWGTVANNHYGVIYA